MVRLCGHHVEACGCALNCLPKPPFWGLMIAVTRVRRGYQINELRQYLFEAHSWAGRRITDALICWSNVAPDDCSVVERCGSHADWRHRNVRRDSGATSVERP